MINAQLGEGSGGWGMPCHFCGFSLALTDTSMLLTGVRDFPRPPRPLSDQGVAVCGRHDHIWVLEGSLSLWLQWEGWLFWTEEERTQGWWFT